MELVFPRAIAGFCSISSARIFWDQWEALVVQTNFICEKFDFPRGKKIRAEFRFLYSISVSGNSQSICKRRYPARCRYAQAPANVLDSLAPSTPHGWLRSLNAATTVPTGNTPRGVFSLVIHPLCLAVFLRTSFS